MVAVRKHFQATPVPARPLLVLCLQDLLLAIIKGRITSQEAFDLPVLEFYVSLTSSAFHIGGKTPKATFTGAHLISH